MEEYDLKQGLQDQINKSRLTLEKVQAGGSAINEAQTEHYLIDPLLASLGYDPWEVMKQGHDAVSQVIPDYTLLPNTPHKWFLEAKRIGHQLQDKDAFQAFSYPFSQGTEWGVLTNGRTWHIYNAYVKKPLPEKRVLQIDDLFADQDAVDKLALLSRRSMQQGGLARAWIFDQVKLIVASQFSAPNSPVRKLLRSISAKAVGSAVDDALVGAVLLSVQQTVQPDIKSLASSANSVPPQNGTAHTQRSSTQHTADGYSFKQLAEDASLATGKKPKSLTFLDGQQRSISSWADAAQCVVEWVISTHKSPLLPYNPGSGHNYFLNMAPVHQTGNAMLSYRTVQVESETLYVDTKRDAHNIATSLSKLLADSSIPPSAVSVTVE